ncbi:hypothetical protein O1611_g1243 [Lasiodiplodia mahajangana]|uniref:Uncharacterized protein n=1 Tax=Lasiodiplodia mahajangana TaxID=1108764 RepID=A0ACC2JXZ2_9PEZI|nr:hypothetical protein O1611_g1243 [Lasiodiplodia mahajangana]
MKVIAAILYGLVVATGALAQSDEYPPLKSEGPYALHVKGRGNSSIDGYLYAVHEFPTDKDPDDGVSVLHYDPISTPVAGNSSYRFYLNTTVDDDSGLGFVVTDITAGDPSKLYRGKAMFWTYFADTNVALLELGAGARPVQRAVHDGWAICWQTRYTVTGFTLSWVTSGKPHNPTCELVDLTKLKLY